MRVLILTISILATTFATQLISTDEIEKIFSKYMRKEPLTKIENEEFQDILEIFRRPEHISKSSLDNSSKLRMSLDCLLCRVIFATVFEGMEDGMTDEELTEVFIDFCTVLGIESHTVCKGAVALNTPIIGYVIRNTPGLQPRVFCGLVLQTAGDPNICRIEDERFDWVVELPPPVTPVNPPVVDPTPLKIALITDAHIDPLYEDQGVAECGEPTCCRKGQQLAQSYSYKSDLDESVIQKSLVNASGGVMLDLSIAPTIRKLRSASRSRFAAPRNPAPAGHWGDYRNCDSPIWAFDNVIDTITKNHKDIDLVYYVGDTIDHGVWETTYDLINDMNRHVIDKIRKNFGDGVPVIPTLGNHESQPTNQFAPPSIREEYLNTTWLYNALADKWSFYLPEEAQETLRDRGDFSIVVRPGLRVISINNNVCYKFNWWLAYDPLDAKRHLDWLVEELYKAEAAGEKVHIIGHIPPGVHDFTYTWTREYNRIVNRFANTIAAEFSGHTHSDEFKIFYSPEGSPIKMAWGAGSTTSYSFYNTNYKILDINPVTYEPNNIWNYVYNLTEANLTPERDPHWFQLYDMKNTFNLPDLSPTSMDNLVHRMVTTDKQLLDVYAAVYAKLSDSRWHWCNDDCKLDHLCKTVVTVLWERQRCEELRRLFYNP